MNSFTIYKEYYDLITLLPEKEQQELLLAITKYMFENIEPNLNEKQMKIFVNLKRPLDKSKSQSKKGSISKPNGNQKGNQTETKKETELVTQQQTHQDVIVVVNNNKNNINNSNELHIEEEKKEKEKKEEVISQELIDKFNSNVHSITPYEFEKLNSWLEFLDEELLEHAINISVSQNKRSLSYIEGILKNWKVNGIKHIQDVDKEKISSKELTEHEIKISEYDWLGAEDENN